METAMRDRTVFGGLGGNHGTKFLRRSRTLRKILNIRLMTYLANDIYCLMNIPPEELFAALSHSTRLRCLVLLMRYAELWVCELTHSVGAAQPHVSRHLAQLRELGLVADRRDGLWIHYRINPEVPDRVKGVLAVTVEGVGDAIPFAPDARILSDMPKPLGGRRCV